MTSVDTFDLAAYLEAEKQEVEAALERAVAAVRASDDLPVPVADAIQHGVLTGGKRLRPVLCVTACRACGGEASADAYDLGASVELVHAYSLIHDDLPCMDDAELRRGRPTTHRAHGEDVAVLAGAALIPAAALWAFQAGRALGHDARGAARITRTLMTAAGAGGMVGGQWLDLLGEGEALDGDALDRLHRHKTGALLTASLVMGAQAASAPAPVLEGLRAYGEAVGLAFQIADDVLDATASAEVLGKNPSDAALDKSTYVSLHGLQAARARAQEEIARATEALDGAGLDAPALRALARYVVERDR